MISRRQSEMMAYVDDCLEPSRRAAFEEWMAGEPNIKRQIEEWRRQNDAIRKAFSRGDRGIAPSRPLTGENSRTDSPHPMRSLRRAAAVRPALRLAESAVQTSPRPKPSAQASPMSLRRMVQHGLGAFVLAAALLVTGIGDRAGRQAEATANAGIAAFRTYAYGVKSPVEYSTTDVADLDRWFAAQFTRATQVIDLSAFGLKLLGGRIIPGARAPAAFVLYETKRSARVGLIIEPMDAPRAANPAWFETGDIQAAYWPGAGHSFALIGNAGEIPLPDLARNAAGR